MTSVKPRLILDQHFRLVEELFSPSAYEALQELCDVVGGVNAPMDRSEFLAALSTADFVVAAQPKLERAEISLASNLKAIVEVSGTFQTGIDYDHCFDVGIEVLSCSPGFKYSVAEMALGLMLAGCRGIVDEHERFRQGTERWLADNEGSDFTLYSQDIGFVGFGAIARECADLLAPFRPRIKAFDPWLKLSGNAPDDIAFCELDEVVSTTRCLVVAAMPTDENYRILSRDLIAQIPNGALVVIISRTHLVDFDALLEAADTGRIRVATDVFPHEPVPQGSPYRNMKNLIVSPHRAAAVPGGRHPIGDMIVHDIKAIIDGRSDRLLKPASPTTVQHIIHAPSAAE
ncbi:MAG: hydroxyacid dehydrogenase [Rhizobiaceae bacterium]|nr:hydroxyacid dehydrogenase [Rhizobiaceae bacterium]